MKVCYTAGPVKKLENCFSVSTNAVEIRIWFLTDDILRIRAGFDGDWDEASYSLTMTAWDSRTDELMKDCRKRVQTAAAELTDGDKQAVIQGSRLKVVVEKAPFRIMVYDKDGSLLHADIPDLAYREDSNDCLDLVTSWNNRKNHSIPYMSVSYFCVLDNQHKRQRSKQGQHQ